MLKNFSLLKKNRNYQFLFFGQSLSFLGTMISQVAFPYQIYSQTHSNLLVGLLSLVQLIPLLFTALFGGVLADRYHRKRLLLIAETFLAISCGLLMWNACLAQPHIWILFVVGSAMSAMSGLHRPAFQGIQQQILQPEDFLAASSLQALMFGVTMIAGPALGGLLIAHLGLWANYAVDGMSFVFSLAALLQLHAIDSVSVPASDESILQSLKQGLRYALKRQELLGSYWVDIVAMIFGMPLALFPAIAYMHGGAKTLGLLYAAPAVGAVLVSFFGDWLHRLKRYGVCIAAAAALWGVAIIFFGLVNNFWLALFFLMLAGGFDTISGIFRQTMWNEVIAPEFRGRLAGIEMISYLSGPKLGDVEAGLVAASFGVATSIISGGFLCVIGVGVCCIALPKFWRYRSAT